MRNIAAGLKCTLRSEMLRTYYQHHEHDALRQYEMENFHKSYRAYKALGGNSFIDDIYKEVRSWEVNDSGNTAQKKVAKQRKLCYNGKHEKPKERLRMER